MNYKHTPLIAALCALNSFNLSAQDCSQDSTGLIPLVDLLTGYYEGYQGGLFPGGTNTMPVAHLQNGTKLAKQIKPLDTAGIVSLTNGKVVMVTLGPSSAKSTIQTFNDSLPYWTDVNNCFTSFNATEGGSGLETMNGDSGVFYWTTIRGTLAELGSSPKQVQVVWLYTGYKWIYPDDPGLVDSSVNEYILTCQEINTVFPNCKLIFLTGNHYSDYSDTTAKAFERRIEPACYKNNIAVKEIIAKQINGDPELRFKGLGKKVPFMTWGPNIWADGKNPRSYDGLSWTCPDDFKEDDGFHLSTQGKLKESGMLRDFLRTSPFSTPWFKDAPKWASCPVLRIGNFDSNVLADDEKNPAFYVWLYPDLSAKNLYFDFTGSQSGIVNYSMYNIAGVKIHDGFTFSDEEDGATDISFSNWQPGLYIAVFEMNGIRLTKKFIVP